MKQRKDIFSVNIQKHPNILEWLDDNTPSHHVLPPDISENNDGIIVNHILIYFDDPNDAVLYKLYWQ